MSPMTPTSERPSKNTCGTVTARGTSVLAVNSHEEHFVMNNTLLIHHGRMIMVEKGRRDLLQAFLKTPYQPPHGVYHVLSLDPAKPGIFQIELDADGHLIGDLPVSEGIAGPLVLKDGEPTIDGEKGIRFDRKPQYAGDDVNWTPDKRQAFNVMGRNAEGQLVVLQLYGTGEHPENSDPTLAEVVDVLRAHGIRDAILCGTSADVQRYSPFRLKTFIWTLARKASQLEAAFGTPRGRRVGAWLGIRRRGRGAADMRRNLFTRATALVLALAMMADPTVGSVGAGLVPARNYDRARHFDSSDNFGPAQGRPLQVFVEQALAEPSVAQRLGIPHPTWVRLESLERERIFHYWELHHRLADESSAFFQIPAGLRPATPENVPPIPAGAQAKGNEILDGTGYGLAVNAAGSATGTPEWIDRKGFLSAAPLSGKPLYQVHVEKAIAAAKAHGHSKMYPMVIVVSRAGEAAARKFFADRDYFGQEDRIRIEVLPDHVPAFIADGPGKGHVLMKTPSEVYLSPAGHGELLDDVLQRPDVVRWLDERGIKIVQTMNIDNQLNPVGDAEVIGADACQPAGAGRPM